MSKQNQNTVNDLLTKAMKEPFNNIDLLLEISIILGFVSENEYDKTPEDFIVLEGLGNIELMSNI